MLNRTAKKKLHILVVDDDSVVRRIHAALLKQLGHQVTVASTGKEALAFIQENAFDLICMDVHMPEMDGIEATTSIRSEKSSAQHIPIIGITSCDKDKQNICLEKGMNGVLNKPIEISQLASLIAHCME